MRQINHSIDGVDQPLVEQSLGSAGAVVDVGGEDDRVD